jgi:hypothetical protein
MDEKLERARCGVLKVGDGRGFVVGGKFDRYIITAAHCLPWFPPCISASNLEERTYRELLGPIEGPSTVWAECCFVDPIGDIAVLSSPDNQELWKEAKAFEALVELLTPLAVADIAAVDAPAWLLPLAGEWNRCRVQHNGGGLWLSKASIAGGMSGSPIVIENGAAIGVVCIADRRSPLRWSG